MGSFTKSFSIIAFLSLFALGCAKETQDPARIPTGPLQKPLIATQIQVGITQQEMSRNRCHLSATAASSGNKVSK